MALFGMLARKQRWGLTIYGWLFLLITLFGLTVFFLFTIHPFLAPDQPVKSEILVVEGWVPDYVFEIAKAEFLANNYRLLVVTGEPVEKGSYLTEYDNFAVIGAATLIRLGLKPEQVAPVPAPYVVRDRTYETGLALKVWLQQSGQSVAAINLMSLGTHARRSRLLFERALGEQIKVGIIAASDLDYNARRWWRYGDGVRTIISEAIAYGYAKFLFSPKE
ncbi:MAG: YdcF family protein [Candidatus Zhuqueibacterota bacterium]